MADSHDEDLIKIASRDSEGSPDAPDGADDLPEIEQATPEQARAMQGPKKAVAIAPAITLKSSGITVPLEDVEGGADAPTRVNNTVGAPRASRPKPAAGPATRKSAGGPPAKKPPAAVSAPEPEGTFLSRNRKWLIPLAAFFALLLVLGIFLLVKSLTTPESEKIAVSANALLTPVNEKIDDADKLTDFREAAHSAKSARAKMSGLQQRANEIGNTEERVATVAVLDAQNALLNAYAGLVDVQRKQMKAVDDLTDQAKDAERELATASTAMTAVGRKPDVDENLTSSAVDNMDETLSDAKKAMARWTKRFKAQKAKRLRFNGQADQLAAFSNQFEAQRSEVGRFYDAPPSQTYSSGGETVDNFESERSSLQSSVAGYDVGQLLLGARGALAHALDMSVRAFPKLRKAWGSQSSSETVAESSYFPGYDRATDAVDRNWLIFKTKLASAQKQAKSQYKSPPMPDV
ncbi:MAG: hypothetical protein JHD02_04290 [Thermoleophilaceae bacterium]|nr:hypothetical protein [Thermoleophilaceae bacterium]